MALNVEFEALDDVRFADLAELVGWADGDHARGKLERAWAMCTHRGLTHLSPRQVALAVGKPPEGSEGLCQAIVDAELGRWLDVKGSRRLYFAGAEERLLWRERKKRVAKENGEKGKEFGKLGGRPKKTPKGDKSKTPNKPQGGFQNNPPILSMLSSSLLSEDPPYPPKGTNGELGLPEPKSKLSPAYREYERIVAGTLGALVERTKVGYRVCDGNAKHIVARLREGATDVDCRLVVWDRCNRWLGTEREEHLCPETLFGRVTKFPKYVAQAWAAWKQQHGDKLPELEERA